MQAVRYLLKTPANRELRIALPPQFIPQQAVEVIVLSSLPKPSAEDKLAALREAARDELFQEDLREIAADFAAVDAEGWEARRDV